MNTADLLAAPATDPTAIYRYRDGLYAVDLLTAAIAHLDFFTWLEAHPSSLEQICTSLDLKPRPVDVMLTLFSAIGLVSSEGGVFRNTEMAREHLVASSRWYLGPYYASLKKRPICEDMLVVLRTGHAANWGSYKDEKAWAEAMKTDAFAQEFTAAMDCRGVYLGQALARAVDLAPFATLLDVAGGSGVYACSLTARHTHLRASVLERVPVDEIARKAIAARGCSDNVSVIAGDMMTGLPEGFDVHLISNVLHDWDERIVRQIIDASFAALNPGGMVMIHDCHINETKTGPLPVAQYSALLMHSTEGKCYSISEIDSYLVEAGFVPQGFTPTAADRSVITARKPI